MLPKPVNLDHFKIIDEGKRLVIRARSGRWGGFASAGFMGLWLAFWSIGCGALFWNLVTDFSAFLLLFSTPFFAAWFAGASMLIFCLYGQEEIIVGSDSIEHQLTAIVVLRHKQVPFKEIRSLTAVLQEGSDQSLWVARLKTDGEPVDLATHFNQDVVDELVAYLTLSIPTLNTKEENGDETNDSLDVRMVGPSDSRWRMEPVVGSEVAFLKQGKFSIGTVLGLLFVNLFWNGIVSGFVLAPFQAEDKNVDFDIQGFGLFGYGLFLTPFVIVGLGMFVGFIASLLEPYRKTLYAFSDRDIKRITSYFGFPWVRHKSITQTVSMELIVGKEDNQAGSMHVNRYGIKFVEKGTKKGRHLFSWKKLTKGEADWISTALAKNLDLFQVDPGKPQTPWD